MKLNEFLSYGLRFCTHAYARSDRATECGIHLFRALKENEERIGSGSLAPEIEYIERWNALVVTDRKYLDKFVADSETGRGYLRVEQFDRDRVFMKSVIRLAADRKLDQWFAGQPLTLNKAERTKLGEEAQADFQGILFTCYGPTPGELWFFITKDKDFINRFRQEARACVKSRDYTMKGFSAEQQYEALTRHQPERTLGPSTIAEFAEAWGQYDLEIRCLPVETSDQYHFAQLRRLHNQTQQGVDVTIHIRLDDDGKLPEDQIAEIRYAPNQIYVYQHITIAKARIKRKPKEPET